MPRRTNKIRQANDEAEGAWLAASRANREEATRRLEAEGASADHLSTRWDQLFEQVCKERPLPTRPLRVQEDLQTWVRGTQLASDEQRYVLELFSESRSKLNLSLERWLEQTAFRLRKDGTLDLRRRYCRINPGASPDEEYRYHRAPRYRQPDPPRRQEQREKQQPDTPSQGKEGRPAVRLGRQQERLLRRLAEDPDYGSRLTNASVDRMAAKLMRKGLIDEQWHLTDGGKRYFEQARQRPEGTPPDPACAS